MPEMALRQHLMPFKFVIETKKAISQVQLIEIIVVRLLTILLDDETNITNVSCREKMNISL